MKNKDYNKAMSLRSRSVLLACCSESDNKTNGVLFSSFAKNLALFKKIRAVRPPDLVSDQKHVRRTLHLCVFSI